MNCDEVFCLYADPKLLLRDLGMIDDNYYFQILALFAFTVLHRVLAYYALRYRLTVEFSNKYIAYVSKLLKHK